jgi:DNA-binding transcriptional LysR family regulator
MHVAQPTMTETIASVESELGVRLFERSNRGTTATLAGKSFFLAAQQIIQRYQKALAEVRKLADKVEQLPVVLGYTDLVMGNCISSVIKEYVSRYPGETISLYKGSINELTVELLHGSADIIFSNQFEIRRYNELHFLKIYETFPSVFMRKGHRLSEKDVLELSDLEGERLFCACSATDRNQLSAAASILQCGGIPFTADSLVNNEEAIMSMVASGTGIYPAANWYRHGIEDSVESRPIDIPVESMWICVAWRDAAFSEIARRIAVVAKRIFKSLDKTDSSPFAESSS